MKNKISLTIILCLILQSLVSVYAVTIKETAQAKIVELEALISQADDQSLDTERERLAVWVANEFLRFADWDASAQGMLDNEREFGKYGPYKSQKTALTAALPDKERQDVVDLLETAISELSAVINGTVVRRPVVNVDWANVEKGEDQFTCNGKPIFLYDYFSKSQGSATDNDTIYNDYLGSIDHPSSINNHYMGENGSLVNWRLSDLKNHPSTRIGYTMLWHKGNPSWWTGNIDDVDEGNAFFITYDIDNPTIRSNWEATLKECAEGIKGSKYIDMGYCLANEPHWYSEEGHWTGNYGEMTSISSYTLEKFQSWLSEKYKGDINSLDSKWEKYYTDFDQIDWTMPVPSSYKGTAKWYDWCRFNMDRGNEWFESLQGAIHSSDADAQTHVKIMTDVFAEEDRHHGIDLEAVTELTTYIGDDAKAQKRNNSQTKASDWESDYAYYWEELAVSYDFMESVSPDKIHVNSESHFLSTSQWREPDMQPAYVRNVYWLATVLGMDANLSWFWARDPDGSIEDRFDPDGNYTESSYAGSAAQQPLVVNEYAKVMMDMNTYSEEIMKLRRLKKPARIFYSETSVINGDEQMQHYFDIYESMFFDGRPMGYVTQKIIEKQDDDNWNVVVVYKTPSVTDAEFNALQTYLDNGGTVVIDNGRSLINDEHNKARTESLTKSNGTLHQIGASASLSQMRTKVNEVLNSEGQNPAVVLAQDNGTTRDACVWRVAQDEDGSYLLNIINLGKNASTISLSMQGGGTATAVTDMLTGKSMGTSFFIAKEGVLLLKVEGQASGIENAFANAEISLHSTSQGLEIKGANGKDIDVYDISGRAITSRKMSSDNEIVYVPTGVVLVNVHNVGTQKVVVK